MPTHRIAALLALIVAFASDPAMAYPENPFLTPQHPTASDVVVFNAYAGPCDLLQHPFEEPVITVAGDQITVRFSGEHYNDGIWCVLGSRIDQVAIGTFPPGSYTVSADWSFAASEGTVTVPLGVLPLTVGGAPSGEPASLPASGAFSLIALVLMLLVVAAMKLGAQRRCCVLRTRPARR